MLRVLSFQNYFDGFGRIGKYLQELETVWRIQVKLSRIFVFLGGCNFEPLLMCVLPHPVNLGIHHHHSVGTGAESSRKSQVVSKPREASSPGKESCHKCSQQKLQLRSQKKHSESGMILQLRSIKLGKWDDPPVMSPCSFPLRIDPS